MSFADKISDSVASMLPEDFDVRALIAMLQTAAAEEVQAWYAYRVAASFLVGFERANVEHTFMELAHDELDDHFHKLLDRLNELGAGIDPINSMVKVADVAECPYEPPMSPYDVVTLLRENVKAEECAIRTYQGICAFTEGKDRVTYHMVRGILADEEDHLTRLNEYLADWETLHGTES